MAVAIANSGLRHILGAVDEDLDPAERVGDAHRGS